jgi:hypothetical protein
MYPTEKMIVFYQLMIKIYHVGERDSPESVYCCVKNHSFLLFLVGRGLDQEKVREPSPDSWRGEDVLKRS